MCEIEQGLVLCTSMFTKNQADPHCLANQNKLNNRHWGLGVPPSEYEWYLISLTQVNNAASPIYIMLLVSEVPTSFALTPLSYNQTQDASIQNVQKYSIQGGF